MSQLERIVGDVAAARALDPRVAVFDVRLEAREHGVIALVGETTSAAAAEEAAARVAAAHGGAVVDEVIRLPDPELGSAVHGVVNAAVAPVHGEPRVSAAQVSQSVLGRRLDLLSRRDAWWRVRADDGYIGWVHHGYLRVGEAAWARAWEHGEDGRPMVSLGAELVDPEGRTLARLPWGARVVRDAAGRFLLPDGRRGELRAGELIDADRVPDRFPPVAERVLRSARRWAATPYLWGGVTPAGADCSGFVQSVYRMHGIPLPRDSDQQARVGSAVEAGTDFAGCRAGDLLFFSERPERVTHVAISLGGSRIIHAALSNGGVAENDLLGSLDAERRLRPLFTCARRVLPA